MSAFNERVFGNGRATVRAVFGTLGPQTLSVSQGTPSAPPSSGIVGSGTTQVAEVVTQRIRLSRGSSLRNDLRGSFAGAPSSAGLLPALRARGAPSARR